MNRYMRVIHIAGLIVCIALLWSYGMSFFTGAATLKTYVGAAVILATAAINLVGVVRPETFKWHPHQS
jgi:hypothetical protein